MGEQTDVPESSDWYNSSYMLVWGSNLPQTRTPDSHFMVEARYKGTKVVAVAPDLAEFVKFADNWLPVKAGMDGAIAMAMTHVILQEFYVDQSVPYFDDYAKTYTDLPYLIRLKETKGGYKADRFLRAGDLGYDTEKADWKTVVYDEEGDSYAVPNGSIGHRWDGSSNWNMRRTDTVNDVENISPALTLLGAEDRIEPLSIAAFEEPGNYIFERNVPVREIETDAGPVLVTTVFDIMCAQTGVNRGIAGDTPTTYEDDRPYTPAWQEKYTNVQPELVAQIAREFAQNAIDSKGRSMIIMGSGINHWYHSDTIYRAILNLVLLTGSQGVNGGGWAHYVGQEKVRPYEGWQTVAMAKDWEAPTDCRTGLHSSILQRNSGGMRSRRQGISLLRLPKGRSTRTWEIIMYSRHVWGGCPLIRSSTGMRWSSLHRTGKMPRMYRQWWTRLQAAKWILRLNHRMIRSTFRKPCSSGGRTCSEVPLKDMNISSSISLVRMDTISAKRMRILRRWS